MVRIKLPLMSIEAHGQLSPGLIFATNAWGQYLKFAPSRRKSGTPIQRRIRHVYGNIATLWRIMTDEEKAAYHTKAVRNRRTNYNQFFHEVWPEVYLFWNVSALNKAVLSRAHLGRSEM